MEKHSLGGLGGVAASDSCFLSLYRQLPLVAREVGGGGHQGIYGPHRAGHKLDIPTVMRFPVAC